MTEARRKDYVTEVAQIILSQLLLDKNEVAAWRSTDFICFDKKIDGFDMPTLSFKIRTPKVPNGGYVQISLDEGRDVYVVEAIRITGPQKEQLGFLREVYCDELHMRIRDLIEDEESLKTIFF